MLDKKYNSKEKEAKWLEYWASNNVYKFERDNRPVYSIDTPPPTVSGKIHIGHGLHKKHAAASDARLCDKRVKLRAVYPHAEGGCDMVYRDKARVMARPFIFRTRVSKPCNYMRNSPEG